MQYLSACERMQALITRTWHEFLRERNAWDERLPEVKDWNSRIRGTR